MTTFEWATGRVFASQADDAATVKYSVVVSGRELEFSTLAKNCSAKIHKIVHFLSFSPFLEILRALFSRYLIKIIACLLHL